MRGGLQVGCGSVQTVVQTACTMSCLASSRRKTHLPSEQGLKSVILADLLGMSHIGDCCSFALPSLLPPTVLWCNGGPWISIPLAPDCPSLVFTFALYLLAFSATGVLSPFKSQS